MRRFASALLLGAAVVSAGSAHAHEGDACGQGDRFEEFSGPLRELAKRRIEWVSSLLKKEHPTARVQLLGFNDFHGQLTDGRRVSNRPVGGAAVLASYLRDEQARFNGETLIIHAGDHVGASPPESALLQDEPSISFLNMLGNRHCTRTVQFHPLCNLVGTLGNHEFDEGVAELKRLIFGGNHANGPFLEPRWTGAKFPYVSSNVIDDDTGDTLLRPFVIKEANGVLVGVIGAVLEGTPSIVTPEGVEGVSFVDEADAINAQVRKLKLLGVETIVVTIHQGGFQASYAGPTHGDATGPTGEIAEIVKRLDSAVDVVISGHSHTFTNALMPNASGHPILVTQAFSSSTAYAEIELTVDRVTRDVVTKSASVVTTYADVAPGNAPSTDVAALVQQAKDRTAPLVNRVVGQASVAITRTQSPAGESALGNLIADSQRAEAGADIALMNPGGIRADLDAGPITWGELFTIQPFGNTLVSMDLTGAQVLRVLEQQWTATSTRFLQISGLSYVWNPSKPIGSRVVSAQVGGAAIDPTRTYRVVANNFIAGGGDGFTVLTEGTNVIGGAVDLDALIAYVEGLGAPVGTVIEGRITQP
ncbi:MAG: bifunctional metallophosphatase/5'-nucleotidase [Myxococcales bacterium]